MSSSFFAVFFRNLNRHVLPGFLISFYYLLRDRCFISPRSRVQLSGKISFGRSTVIKAYAVIQTQTGRISMGKNCAVSSFNHISTGEADVVIGDYVRIAPNVTILGGTRNFKDKTRLIMEQGSSHSGLVIGSDVLIGAGTVILPGCQIGPGAVIGAGSVVSSDIPEYSVAAGAPARVVGRRE
jgi:acetyltransferase-like isoleucine patch superfamily enzyme